MTSLRQTGLITPCLQLRLNIHTIHSQTSRTSTLTGACSNPSQTHVTIVLSALISFSFLDKWQTGCILHPSFTHQGLGCERGKNYLHLHGISNVSSTRRLLRSRRKLWSAAQHVWVLLVRSILDVALRWHCKSLKALLPMEVCARRLNVLLAKPE